MRSFSTICLCMVLVLGTGCATIIRGSTQNIPVQTAPGAVSFDVGGFTYTTPTTLELERKNEYVLEFSKDGYESSQIRISKHISGGYIIMDALLTGLLGVVVDAVTGAWYNLKPESITVSLSKISSVPGPDDIEISINRGEGSDELEVTSSVPEVYVRVIPVQ